MSLTLYIGPMFAGKSSTALGIIRRNNVIDRPTLCLTSAWDVRYAADKIVSHDQESHSALSVKTLMPVILRAEFESAACILVEEAQFFPDLLPFVLFAVEQKKKDVYCFGLDGDSNRQPFGQLNQLLPYCDRVEKLTALCLRCGDGTPAIFTHRRVASEAQVAVGGADEYEALCRWHYLMA